VSGTAAAGAVAGAGLGLVCALALDPPSNNSPSAIDLDNVGLSIRAPLCHRSTIDPMTDSSSRFTRCSFSARGEIVSDTETDISPLLPTALRFVARWA
jgi:hypothetical protein